MKASSQPGTSSKLSESVHHQLNMYAVAARAAGVSLLALAQPADAKIVYTSAHQVIKVGHDFKLDLNHDGIADFRFLNTYGSQGGGLVDIGVVNVNKQNLIWGYKHSVTNGYASALSAGVHLGSNQQKFAKHHYGMAAVASGGGSWGPWRAAENRYLGLRFMIKSQVHYGWARLSVSKTFPPYATLTGYAYETMPNKPITTGKTEGKDVITVEPATLGRMALGRK
jgi:hypothetical protein